MKKIKVLHIIKSLGRGGAEMLLPETLRLHDKNQFEFHYAYFLPWKNQMVESIERNRGTVVCFEANNNMQLIANTFAVAKYIRKEKIKLIHAHLPWGGILARIVGQLSGVPVMYTEHNKQERYHTGTRVLNLLSMNFQKMLIAVSSDVAESVRKHKRHLKPPLRVITNGVNTDHFNKRNFTGKKIRQELNIPPECLVIGTVAVFRSQKRLDLWIELACKILEKFRNVQFIIVGDGPLREIVRNKIEELKMVDKVHLPGLETEVRPYLVSFDLYMMSSMFEGLPIAMLEAMSMECPVISTDAGGIKEVIRHETDGLLCSVEEPEKLVNHALTLLHNAELRSKYGKQARRRIEEQFGMEKMVNELEKVYLEIALKN